MNTAVSQQVNRNGLRFLAFIGIIIFSVGMYILVSTVHLQNVEKEIKERGVPVTAVCTDVWTETKTVKHKNAGKRTSTTTHYYASAQYTYGTESYRCSKLSVDADTNVGSTVTVYILPDSPSDWSQMNNENWILSILVVSFIPLTGLVFINLPILAGLGIIGKNAPVRTGNALPDNQNKW